MIDIINIPGFISNELYLRRCYALCKGYKCMLICCETGTTLCLEREMLDFLIKQDIPDDLILLLVQRGFADYQNSRKLSCAFECVKPEFFLVDMTKSCNLKCKYCFREDVGGKSHISAEMIDKICDSLASYWKSDPALRLTIQPWGGEPLLEYPLILRLRKNFDEEGLTPEIVIETNATLITREMAENLYRNNIKIGVSIDGSVAVQNIQRPYSGGKGSFDDVKRGIQYLREAGYKNIGTISVVTQNTLDYLDDIFACFTEELQLTSIKFNLMRKNDNNVDLAIPLDKIDAYVEKLLGSIRLLYNNGINIIEQNISQRMLNLLYRPNNNICNAYGCHGGYRMLSISMNGKVYPCELTDYDEFSIGDLNSGDFKVMAENAINACNEYFAKRKLDKCNDCPWLYYCRGGCRSSVKYSKNNTFEIDDTECAFNRAIYPRLVDIILSNLDYADYLMKGLN